MLVKVPGKDTEAVVRALSQHVRKLPANLRRSLTWEPRIRDGRPQEVYGSHQCESVLLRPAESVAARYQ
jgi:hypothetical protein